mmetsp:Transcript_1990/g.3633  ORF Transcript_1990/g.3633 Transcript_1990/m.3633 type:complete len:107 (+) Transcript_1990:198-518(+)
MPEFNKKWQDVPEMGFSVAPCSLNNAIQVSECRLGCELLPKSRWRADDLVLYNLIKAVGRLRTHPVAHSIAAVTCCHKPFDEFWFYGDLLPLGCPRQLEILAKGTW